MWFLLCYFLYLLWPFCSSHKFIAIQIFYSNTIWIYEFWKNHWQRGAFGNVNLSNLEKLLWRNWRTHRVEKCIFRASGGTNLEKCSTQCQTWCCLFWFNEFPICLKKSGYISPDTAWECSCLILFLKFSYQQL